MRMIISFLMRRCKMKKYHVEDLTEKAKEWFYDLGYGAEEIIINEYMRTHNIKEDEVEW
jgi:hypothetical protein